MILDGSDKQTSKSASIYATCVLTKDMGDAVLRAYRPDVPVRILPSYDGGFIDYLCEDAFIPPELLETTEKRGIDVGIVRPAPSLDVLGVWKNVEGYGLDRDVVCHAMIDSMKHDHGIFLNVTKKQEHSVPLVKLLLVDLDERRLLRTEPRQDAAWLQNHVCPSDTNGGQYGVFIEDMRVNEHPEEIKNWERRYDDLKANGLFVPPRVLEVLLPYADFRHPKIMNSYAHGELVAEFNGSCRSRTLYTALANRGAGLAWKARSEPLEARRAG